MVATRRTLLWSLSLWTALGLSSVLFAAEPDRAERAGAFPEPAWTTVTWCSGGLRFDAPTYGRRLERSLHQQSARVQSYRIEELRPLSDGFYEFRPGDYFFELRLEPKGAATGFRAEECARPPRKVGAFPGSRWCRVGETVELGGEASYTHVAEIPHGDVVLRLTLDASALPEPDVRRIFESLRWLDDPCPDTS